MSTEGRIDAARRRRPRLRPGPALEIEPIAGDGWYVIVAGRPVGRFGCREEAEPCARDW